MKHAQRLLALLLTALLAFSLSAPAMAVTREDITITGPAGVVPFGQAFTLRVAVDLPDGTEVVAYQWWCDKSGGYRIDGATDADLYVTLGDACYPEAYKPYYPARRNYACIVTFAEKDTVGNVINTFTLTSQDVRIDMNQERKRNFGEILKDSFEEGGAFVAMSSVMSGFFLLPFFPVTFVIGFFLAFFSFLFE